MFPAFVYRLYPVIRFCLGVSFAGLVVVSAAVRLPSVLSDHMVLQRADAVPIWGWANPGEEIHVVLDTVSGSTRADADGAWQIALDLTKLQGDGPYVMTVLGENKIEINDVLIGQVWLASGQSNMYWPVRNSNGGQQVARDSAADTIREFQVKLQGSNEPQQDLQGQWVVAQPGKTESFSAVAYFFAKKLHADLGQPIGIIHSSWGGASAEAWISAKALATDPELDVSLKRKNRLISEYDATRIEFGNTLQSWAEANNIADEEFAPAETFHSAPAVASDWKQIPDISGAIASNGLLDCGVLWGYRQVDLPASSAGKDIAIRIQEGHGFATFYWNGYRFYGPEKWDAKALQETGGQGTQARVVIPASYVKEGENILAVRFYLPLPAAASPGWRISITGAAGFSAALEKDWLVRAEKVFEPGPQALASAPTPFRTLDEVRHRPAWLYNAMIAPLVPYRIAGVIWYQGETNAGRATQYQRTFPLLIQDWREHWQQPALPFYFCQLANYGDKRNMPEESAWAELREAQSLTLGLPKTGQAVLIDVGEAKDIHPRDKTSVGERLARIALANDYGQHDLVASGPELEEKAVVGNTVYLKFKDHGVGSELTSRPLGSTYLLRTHPGPQTAPLQLPSPGSQLQGFAVCGKDGKWFWAQARIEGTHSIAVSSDQVAKPLHVRYAWADNPTCNLYNVAGLPASPFRTDDFTPKTINGRF